MIEETLKELMEQVGARISNRINDNKEAFNQLRIDRFYVAGGALLEAEPNDYDLFPVETNDFNGLFGNTGTNIIHTANASTYNINGIKIQLCRFYYDSLQKLVDRFDFTHCKVGAEFVKDTRGGIPFFVLKDVYVSKDFIRYKLIGNSEYCKDNDYPLAALVRMHKYVKQGYIKDVSSNVFRILEAILQRGCKSELDFSCQIRGLYLGEEESIVFHKNKEVLNHIYYLLTGKVMENLRVVFGKSIGVNKEDNSSSIGIFPVMREFD